VIAKYNIYLKRKINNNVIMMGIRQIIQRNPQKLDLHLI